MNGYINYNTNVIRLRSSSFDVSLGNGSFVTFDTLDQAKAFVDGGRQVTDQVVYDMATQTPITN